MRRVLPLLGPIAVSAVAMAFAAPESGRVTAAGMDLRWYQDGEWIEFTFSAPSQGWLAIGFNDVNDIVGADLFMLRVRAGTVEGEEHLVLRAGDHRNVLSLGMPPRLRVLDGSQTASGTVVRFRIATTAGEARRPALSRGSTHVLILAYSVSDDFDHHSRQRIHLPITL